MTERPPPLPPAYTGDQDLYASRENEELNRVCILRECFFFTINNNNDLFLS